MKTIRRLAISVGVLCGLGALAYGQSTSRNEALFQELKTERTNSRAYERFLALGKKDQSVRAFLAARLPNEIAVGPGENRQAWAYQADLAGRFKLEEAIPALIQNIDQHVSVGYSTFSSEEYLAEFPAGFALGMIGKPSVAPLASVLATGDFQKRWVASRALNIIEDQSAIDALEKHLAHESDHKLRAYIEQAITRKRGHVPRPTDPR